MPTLQRNILCKLFGRADFTPEEVLAVGYERLRKADGIGPRGLKIIVDWLLAHGLMLRGPVSGRADRHVQHIKRAIRLLERHGYQVRPPAGAARQEARRS